MQNDIHAAIIAHLMKAYEKDFIDLKRSLGVSQQVIDDIQDGRGAISYGKAGRLAAFFEVDRGRLVNRADAFSEEHHTLCKDVPTEEGAIATHLWRGDCTIKAPGRQLTTVKIAKKERRISVDPAILISNEAFMAFFDAPEVESKTPKKLPKLRTPPKSGPKKRVLKPASEKYQARKDKRKQPAKAPKTSSTQPAEVKANEVKAKAARPAQKSETTQKAASKPPIKREEAVTTPATKKAPAVKATAEDARAFLQKSPKNAAESKPAQGGDLRKVQPERKRLEADAVAAARLFVAKTVYGKQISPQSLPTNIPRSIWEAVLDRCCYQSARAMSNKAWGKLFGVSDSMAGHWRTGRNTMSIKYLEPLAKVAEIPFEDMMALTLWHGALDEAPATASAKLGATVTEQGLPTMPEAIDSPEVKALIAEAPSEIVISDQYLKQCRNFAALSKQQSPVIHKSIEPRVVIALFKYADSKAEERITLQQWALKMNVSTTAIRQWRSGKYGVSLRHMDSFAAATDLAIDDIHAVMNMAYFTSLNAANSSNQAPKKSASEPCSVSEAQDAQEKGAEIAEMSEEDKALSAQLFAAERKAQLADIDNPFDKKIEAAPVVDDNPFPDDLDILPASEDPKPAAPAPAPVVDDNQLDQKVEAAPNASDDFVEELVVLLQVSRNHMEAANKKLGELQTAFDLQRQTLDAQDKRIAQLEAELERGEKVKDDLTEGLQTPLVKGSDSVPSETVHDVFAELDDILGAPDEDKEPEMAGPSRARSRRESPSERRFLLSDRQKFLLEAFEILVEASE